MQLRIDETEIHEAISDWISKEGLALEGKKVEIDMTAGRGTTGHYADITITRDDVVASAQEETPFKSNAELAADENTGTEEDQPALDMDLDTD